MSADYVQGVLATFQVLSVLAMGGVTWVTLKRWRHFYRNGWRDGQWRFLTLMQELGDRGVPLGEALVSATNIALNEDPAEGRKHLPWAQEGK